MLKQKGGLVGREDCPRRHSSQLFRVGNPAYDFMNWAIYTILGLNILSLGLAIGAHGNQRSPTNAWYTLIAVIFEVVLLYFGGALK